jgi:type IV fimbrial biogenesis protein FimT
VAELLHNAVSGKFMVIFTIVHTSSRHIAKGFTLIELMVTIALVAILASLAVPNFAPVIASTRLSTATNELYASLAQAKSEAIRTGNRVTICPSATGTSCATATTPTWSNGWITFIDATRTTALPVVDAGESILQVGQPISSDIVITGSTPYASYSSDGTTRLINGGLYAATIRVCSTSNRLNNNNRTRDIQISRTGRAVIVKTTGVARACPAPGAP